MYEDVAKGDDFTEFDNDRDLILDRIDRNGSHYYHSNKCPKCGGTGYIPSYNYYADGICFLCNGSGHYTTKIKVMTETHWKALAEKRVAKLRKEASEYNEGFLDYYGFNQEGKAWIALGNTYEIREELKTAGAKFNNIFGWVFPFEQCEYDTLEINKDMEMDKEYDLSPDKSCEDRRLIVSDYNGRYCFPSGMNISHWLKDKKIEREIEIKYESGKASDYVGEIGVRIVIDAKLTRIAYYDTEYCYNSVRIHIFTFEDEDGNQFIWKTSSYPDKMVKGETLKIKGTVKKHDEYNGQKQTELTRCKILEEG